ncbi:MAG TPA: prolipoprotein diacylglyceryl transferase [Parvularculaceae bacterium]|nr:prolipoprotein diacylglyceryl transferase [Parvularculaceae bacterium]HRX37845.1 prolipoprotein diacylglyceryl transferase [Parvularculaceae bacterium]
MSLPYPNIDPVAVHLGPLPIRWYSLAYIGGLAAGWFYLTRLIKNSKLWPSGAAPLTRTQLDDVIFWVAIGVIAGGRLGYLLFYEPNLLIEPWQSLGANMAPGFIKSAIGWLPIPPALMLWKGGMSFHGGLIGVTLAGFLFARQNKLPALSMGDLFACGAPIGLFFGRLANFINAELYGRPWDGAWSMVFPTDPLQVARHPSQLYEAALEGITLFIVIRIATHVFHLLKRPGATIGVFLMGYSLARIFVENFREPDAQMPDFPLGLTMGMMLSMPMFALGLWLLLRTRMKSAPAKTGPA